MSGRGRPGTDRLVAAAFALTVLGAVFFAAVYVLGNRTQLLGLALFLAFAGLAAGFAVWAGRLLPQGPYVEEREAMISPPEARRVFASELDRDQEPVVRAALPRRMLMLALGTLAVAFLFPIRSLLFSGPTPWRALGRTAWRDGVRIVDAEGRPLRPSDIARGGIVTVFPEGRVKDDHAMTVLVRVDPARLALPGGRGAWTVDGVVAYSKICTHAGCPVALYVQTAEQLVCPCHQSVFDVLKGAPPVAGPAARPLPQLPIGVDAEGMLVARGDFPAPVGPGYWRTT
ncbi:QcrA and Rieske domain-containing protein [Microtetraspora niveoalba]|uniref:QcrA and Rieske domain-containing protein n=1 Tax=Microtetraspora niveoalba TaxID=46175 RepID=UPI000832A956|nr:Rieske (2Fe-2S) protein [Microtetraspora niveoalba]